MAARVLTIAPRIAIPAGIALGLFAEWTALRRPDFAQPADAVDLGTVGPLVRSTTGALDLSSILEIIPSRKRIVHYATGSFYRALPAESAGSHGFNASAIIADELHAWTQTDRELLNVLMTSTGSSIECNPDRRRLPACAGGFRPRSTAAIARQVVRIRYPQRRCGYRSVLVLDAPLARVRAHSTAATRDPHPTRIRLAGA